MAFKLGDTVGLKSGGPTMTVELIDGDGVHCFWFDGKNLKRDIFPEAALEPRKPPAPGVIVT